MPFTETSFPGLMVFEPRVFEDSRGYFFESYNSNTIAESGIDTVFVQDNQARSVYGVVRGLHYQLSPHAQTKFIRVLQGAILDVVLDIRLGSPTYGKHFSIELSASNKKQLYIPHGFAHGYAVLSETAEVFYKCDAFYNKELEGGILYNDPTLDIDWQIPAAQQIVSDKDIAQPLFADCRNNFIFPTI
jgi:dTDP-4-dehydrorhamnose 3,5-epimerase